MSSFINIRIEIKDEQIDNWLSTAFEGGINYWCDGIEVKDNDYKGTKYASECISKGGTIIVEDKEINKQNILDALTWLSNNKYTKALDRLINGGYDADDADVLFQVVCFGNVIYG
tara:strand:+ start:36 stop:380 length:345 start_codon:yes stop_codon:yes gene_type:complete